MKAADHKPLDVNERVELQEKLLKIEKDKLAERKKGNTLKSGKGFLGLLGAAACLAAIFLIPHISLPLIIAFGAVAVVSGVYGVAKVADASHATLDARTARGKVNSVTRDIEKDIRKTLQRDSNLQDAHSEKEVTSLKTETSFIKAKGVSDEDALTRNKTREDNKTADIKNAQANRIDQQKEIKELLKENKDAFKAITAKLAAAGVGITPQDQTLLESINKQQLELLKLSTSADAGRSV